MFHPAWTPTMVRITHSASFNNTHESLLVSILDLLPKEIDPDYKKTVINFCTEMNLNSPEHIHKNSSKYGINTTPKTKAFQTSFEGKEVYNDVINQQISKIRQLEFNCSAIQEQIRKIKEMAYQLVITVEKEREKHRKISQANSDADTKRHDRKLDSKIQQLEKIIASYDVMLQDLSKKQTQLQTQLQQIRSQQTQIHNAINVSRQKLQGITKTKNKLLNQFNIQNPQALTPQQRMNYITQLKQQHQNIQQQIATDPQNKTLQGQFEYINHQLAHTHILETIDALESANDAEILENQELEEKIDIINNYLSKVPSYKPSNHRKLKESNNLQILKQKFESGEFDLEAFYTTNINKDNQRLTELAGQQQVIEQSIDTVSQQILEIKDLKNSAEQELSSLQQQKEQSRGTFFSQYDDGENNENNEHYQGNSLTF